MATAMGRIIRACAELEDIASLYLYQIADIGEPEAMVMIPRAALSAKITMAKTLVEALGGKAKERFDACFTGDAWISLIRCRNIIAHGVLLGRTDEGKIAFRTAELVGSDKVAGTELITMSLNVISYEIDDFATFAKIGEHLIVEAERILKLGALRKRRRSQAILPHRKAQPTRQPSAKPSPPRKSSKD